MYCCKDACEAAWDLITTADGRKFGKTEEEIQFTEAF